MGIKTFKPTSPAVRAKTSLTFDEITTDRPEKSLIVSKGIKTMSLQGLCLLNMTRTGHAG